MVSGCFQGREGQGLWGEWVACGGISFVDRRGDGLKIRGIFAGVIIEGYVFIV